MKPLLCVFIFGLFISASAFAQEGWNWLEKPLDAGNVASKLPLYLKGHDPRRVYLTSERLGIRKSEYETTAHFEQRRRDVRNKPLFGQVYITSPITLIKKPSTSYDADSETLTLRLIVAPSDKGSNLDVITYNNFGTRIVNQKELPFVAPSSMGGNRTVAITINASPEKAKEIRKKTLIASSGTIVEPLRAMRIVGGNPYATNLMDAISSMEYRYLLFMRIKSITFFNEPTGYVYGRFSAKQKGSAPDEAPPSS